MNTLTSLVSIPTPSRYMTRLAKHFEHRVTVERTEEAARIIFPDGVCAIHATPSELQLHIEANNSESLTRYRDLVERHLKQVAASEQFEVAWR